MIRRYAPWFTLVVAVGALAISRESVADDPPSKDKDKAKADSSPKPATVKVEKALLSTAVTLKGVVQAEQAAELVVRLKSGTGQLVVRKFVEHGTTVKAGEVLVEFDPEKLDHAIRDARHEREQSEIAIRQAEVELPLLEKQAPLDLAAAEREFQHATQDLKHNLDVEQKMAIQTAQFMLKVANFAVEFAKDELKQLQKMYRDKDLTEETERMILKRYQFGLEMDEFFAAQTKLRTEHRLQVDIPRLEVAAKEAVAKAELALLKARDVNPLTLKQKQLALAKLRYDEARAKEKLAELEADRASLTVKSPTDGVVYHGRYVRGQWMVPTGSQGHALNRGGTINPGDVFMTVVGPGKLVVRAEAEEKELPGLTAGLNGRLTPTAFPDEKRAATLAHVSAAPLNNKFEVIIDLEGKAAGLVPGMTGNIRFVTARKPNALTVPTSAVFEDTVEDAHYVYRPAVGAGKPEKRTVKVGITSGEKIEVLDGLAEGDEILAAKP